MFCLQRTVEIKGCMFVGTVLKIVGVEMLNENGRRT
jgi:hypothetical protein